MLQEVEEPARRRLEAPAAVVAEVVGQVQAGGGLDAVVLLHVEAQDDAGHLGRGGVLAGRDVGPGQRPGGGGRHGVIFPRPARRSGNGRGPAPRPLQRARRRSGRRSRTGDR